MKHVNDNEKENGCTERIWTRRRWIERTQGRGEVGLWLLGRAGVGGVVGVGGFGVGRQGQGGGQGAARFGQKEDDQPRRHSVVDAASQEDRQRRREKGAPKERLETCQKHFASIGSTKLTNGFDCAGTGAVQTQSQAPDRIRQLTAGGCALLVSDGFFLYTCSVRVSSTYRP